MSLTAWPIDGYSSDAEVIRQMQGSLIGSAGGLVASGGLTLTQKGTPNMSVQILGGTPAEGGLWIPGYTTTTGPYYFQNSATYEQVIETAGASFPRIDTIVARIYDNAVDGLGKKEPVFEALKGAEESGVTLGNKKGAHAAVKNTYILGYVLVPAKASSIVTADIENTATAVGLGIAAGQVYGAKVVERLNNTEYEPSATRATFVVVTVVMEPSTSAGNWRLEVGGVEVSEVETAGAGVGPATSQPISFICPAGKKWKVIRIGGAPLQRITSSYLPL